MTGNCCLSAFSHAETTARAVDINRRQAYKIATRRIKTAAGVLLGKRGGWDMTSLWSRLRKLFVSDANKNSNRTKRPRARSFSGGRFEQLESRELLTVTYHGGALLTHVEAQPVFLGSDWATNSSLTSQSASLNTYVGYLVNSPYMDMLTNAGYNVGRGTSSPGATLSLSLDKSTTGGITDQQIQADIQAGINGLNGTKLQPPDANRLYVVYVEPGVVVKLGSDSSRNSFLGYHGAFRGTVGTASVDVRYDVLPYPGTPNPTPGSQGYASAFDELTSVTSHELAEAVTDPDVNYKTLGWYDDNRNGEIGDLTSSQTRLNGYLVQNVVGKNDQVISPVDTSGGSGGGGGGGTTTLSPPTNVSASAVSSTSARITWTGSTGATGYRIMEFIGGTYTSLGAVAATASSATVTNLTAGSTVTFKVEAYSGTTIADSAAVSVTLLAPPAPPQTTLTAPQVTAAAASSTSAALSWGAVAGAQGYRIYWWNGYRAVLIGTVSASRTSVTVTGLYPGSTSQFLVQAYAGTTVANSSWVSVTTPRSTFRV
jgi:hypothetical protein